MSRAAAIRPREILRFALLMAAFGGAVSWSYDHPGLYRHLAPAEGWTAAATHSLLLRTGIEVERAGTLLAHPAGFAYDLGYRCTGLVVAAFLVVGLMALPLPRGRRLWGLLVGVPVVMAANLARLVSLYFVGVHLPGAFDFAHLVLWEAAMVLLILAVWAACLRPLVGEDLERHFQDLVRIGETDLFRHLAE